MAGGLKLFDYRMTEKEHILAETIIEMTDKSELFLLAIRITESIFLVICSAVR